MKVFIWEDLDEVSDNYHTGGGLVIIAESLDDAVAIVADKKHIKIDKPPTRIIGCADTEEKKVYVFPDAGCC